MMSAAELKQLLAERGLNATDLARLLETDPRNPQRWLKGTHKIKGPIAQAIRTALRSVKKKRKANS